MREEENQAVLRQEPLLALDGLAVRWDFNAASQPTWLEMKIQNSLN